MKSYIFLLVFNIFLFSCTTNTVSLRFKEPPQINLDDIKKVGVLSFRIIDINSSDFSLNLKYVITYKQAMERIHSLKSDGSVIKGIKVFQEAYSLIGLGWIYAPTKLPILDKFIDFIYGLWAKYRLKITFRPSIEKLCNKKDFQI